MAFSHQPAQGHQSSLGTTRLPSIRDLNFPYDPPPQLPPDPVAPPSGPIQQSEHRAAPAANQPQRHDWNRQAPPPPPPQLSIQIHRSQHSPVVVNSHDHPRHEPPFGQAGGNLPLSSQMPPPPPRDSESTQKRPRTSAPPVGVSPRSSSHSVYPQPPTYPSQPPPAASSYMVPPPHEQTPHHPAQYPPPPSGYPNYPPHMTQRGPPPAGYPHQPSHPSQYPPVPSPAAEHWQQHSTVPSQPSTAHPPPVAYSKPVALVPTAVEARGSHVARPDMEKVKQRQGTMTELLQHCNVLYTFASKYAQAQASGTGAQKPSQAEIAEMGHRANVVMRLCEELKRLSLSEGELAKGSATVAPPPEEHRAPKRPWEDISADGTTGTDAEAQATAEADMALIRTKRATTAGQNGGPGQPKSKYRKRSRATPPGKCHSCNIRETPEWRRGPDGARTLCNACGLHYAKLMRKRDKAAGPDGKAPNIDLETLRASTRMADSSHRDANNRSGNTGSNNNNSGSQSAPAGAPPADTKPPPSSPSQKSDSTRPSPAVSKAGPPQSPVPQATSNYHPNPSGPGVPPQHQSAHAAQMMPPPSIPSGGDAAPLAWQGTRGYSTEHGSFMRAHAPPSHARGAPPFHA